MSISAKSRLIRLAFACLLTGLAPVLLAQGHPGGSGGGSGMGGGMNRGMNRPGFPGGTPGAFPGNTSNGNGRDHSPPNGGPTESTMAGGLQLAPPGRWWDDSGFAHSLGIDSRQQHRMDDVFSSNRGNMLNLYKSLQHEEKELAKTIRSKELDEAQIFQQIDRVTQARGELEKANAHMLLQIRREMSPEQTAKLDEHRPNPQ